MSRTVYVNGDYLPEAEAKVSIFASGSEVSLAVEAQKLLGISLEGSVG